MSSLTKKTRKIRRRKKATAARSQKRKRAEAGTPKFPIIPEAAKSA